MIKRDEFGNVVIFGEVMHPWAFFIALEYVAALLFIVGCFAYFMLA